MRLLHDAMLKMIKAINEPPAAVNCGIARSYDRMSSYCNLARRYLSHHSGKWRSPLDDPARIIILQS